MEEYKEYKAAKTELKDAITKTKKDKWEELRNDINQNPWGLGYKIVMKKLEAKQSTPELNAAAMEHIVSTLFPTHDLRRDAPEHAQESSYLPFTMEEMYTAANTLKTKKAPDPDGIPVEVLKLIALEHPHLLLSMYSACLNEGIFPEIWKRQHLTLISKGKGDPGTSSAYRPLCMLDTAGKLLEILLKPRIIAAINDAGGLSERQHGFRPGRCTIGAVEDVVRSVEEAHRKNNFSRPIVLLATLDIRNAFNSAKWANMIDALESRFKTPLYLMKMIRSYLKDRKLLYDTSDGPKSKEITSGAAQGSILGSDLWNASYDGILNVEMPDDCYLVGYADDIAAVITARNTEMATQTWLNSHGLSLAAEKTEVILLTRKHIPLETIEQLKSSNVVGGATDMTEKDDSSNSRASTTLNNGATNVNATFNKQTNIHYATNNSGGSSNDSGALNNDSGALNDDSGALNNGSAFNDNSTLNDNDGLNSNLANETMGYDVVLGRDFFKASNLVLICKDEVKKYTFIKLKKSVDDDSVEYESVSDE
ncbi:PREDICTED: uncharacterized protein LOC108970924, partial [Bactrocera latifrons]|uniref:uncharacterized protein LOC108970924 n=1 Tax=Bactrocera latifrons TaxID=174628 RepID=UPI0008DD0565